MTSLVPSLNGGAHQQLMRHDRRRGERLRLYDAIEAGLTDLNDEALKERMTGLKAIRDQAKAEAERLQMTLDSSGNQTITVDMLNSLASVAREGLRLEKGGYRRDQLRTLAQRVEVADDEVRITGSKSELLRTLAAASSGQTAAFGVSGSVLKWRTRQDSNL